MSLKHYDQVCQNLITFAIFFGKLFNIWESFNPTLANFNVNGQDLKKFSHLITLYIRLILSNLAVKPLSTYFTKLSAMINCLRQPS